jgi:hypothetical protein
MTLANTIRRILGLALKDVGAALHEVRTDAEETFNFRKNEAWAIYSAKLNAAGNDLKEARDWVEGEAAREYEAVVAVVDEAKARLGSLLAHHVLPDTHDAAANALHDQIARQ